ncbi:MAG TPA: 3D domain-containing protein [Candidatus Hydrogenedentes bacterium]|nr:3D domain-containing protein [Candidatus Hydrogenedentota bacterium]
MRNKLYLVATLALCAMVFSSCATVRRVTGIGGEGKPSRRPDFERSMEVSAFCSCGKCTNWTRNWLGKPVVASGPNRGQPKKVGITASGEKARPGTIAAHKKYPFGTVMYVPGYGYGTVQDRGGALGEDHIDVYFKSHGDALKWGRQRLPVKVWLPR